MNCGEFEKLLFENPRLKEIIGDAGAHAEGCPKCSELFAVHSALGEISFEKEALVMEPQKRSFLINQAKAQLQKSSGLPKFLEDALVQSLIISMIVIGAFLSLPKIVHLRIFDTVEPYLKPAIDLAAPFYEKLSMLFSFSGGMALLTFIMFSLVFSLEVYFRTVAPVKRTR